VSISYLTAYKYTGWVQLQAHSTALVQFKLTYMYIWHPGHWRLHNGGKMRH